MMYRRITKIEKITIFILCLMGGNVLSGTAQDKRPNIIFICTDDQADWTVGASGNKEAITPNLDRLAKEGAYLSNKFVTTPVCSPARATILTSKYASEVNIPDFIISSGSKLYTKEKAQVGLPSSEVTFAELLRNVGYTTALFGKWHLGNYGEGGFDKFHPTNFGFQYYEKLPAGVPQLPARRMIEYGITDPEEGFTDDILTTNVIQYLDEIKEDPFLLCVMYRTPHAPWRPAPKVDRAVYGQRELSIPNPDYPDLDVERVKRMMRFYMVTVATVDRNVGRILDALDEMGISDNTIVIFTSDNGLTLGHNGIWHKGNGYWLTKTLPAGTEHVEGRIRPNLYDKSMKVPGIIRWPGTVSPGIRIANTVSSLDWFPTILEMAGLDVSVAPKGIRGHSIVPLLKQENIRNWDNDLYAEYSMVNYATALMRTYRTPEWKLVRDFLDPSRDELYNLKDDPEESHNLINNDDNDAKAAIRELDKKLRDRMREIKDPLLQAAEKNDFTEYLKNTQ